MVKHVISSCEVLYHLYYIFHFYMRFSFYCLLEVFNQGQVAAFSHQSWCRTYLLTCERWQLCSIPNYLTLIEKNGNMQSCEFHTRTDPVVIECQVAVLYTKTASLPQV